MRPAILAVALGAALLSAGCDSSTEAAAPAGTAAATPATSAPAVAAAPDYSTNTRVVCNRVRTIVDAEIRDFGAQLGKMIANKEAKRSAEAAEAQQAAAKELRTAGTGVRKTTATAQDPQLKIAGATSAAKFVRSSGDKAFFAGIRTTADLDRSLRTRLPEWLNPVTGYCA